MKKIELIILLFIFTGLIVVSAFLFYFTANNPPMYNVERAQQSYEKSIANPKPLSAEEKTVLIGKMVESERARKEVWDSLFEGVKGLGKILLSFSFLTIVITISIYKRKGFFKVPRNN